MVTETPTPETASLSEIAGLFAHLPTADEAAAEAARTHQGQLTKPAGSLGRLEDIAVWMASWQGQAKPRLERPMIAVFAGNHGVARRGVSAFPMEVTNQMVRNFIDGGGAINQIAQLQDAELRVYEMALEEPTEDFVDGPALDDSECARAMAFGMMAIEERLDLVCFGEMGIGNTTSAAALCHALYGGNAADWTGPGTGVSGAALTRKTEVVAAAVARHADRQGDPLRILAALGGHEIAAIAGAILACRMARAPVLLDGYVASAAAAVLHAMAPGALDHCLAAHCSAEPAHRALLAHLDKAPLLDLGMRLGEGSGAGLAIGVVRAAVACHNDMATFETAGVSAGGPGDR